jgi:glutamate/tyrosine decarboxylase-like PLP-dependent enzyme
MPTEDVLKQLEAKRAGDADWHGGRCFGYVYNAGDRITDLLKEVYNRFGMTNALNPMAFPSLKNCEAEVMSMTADLLNGPEAAGTITTGGTESICMAIKTARNWGRAERKIDKPEMVMPATAHPAHYKGAHYFDVKAVVVPVEDDFQVDINAVREAVTERTVLVCGSAPNFPYGVVDPIEELGALAKDKGILCHVDACMGGFFLPFMERLGYQIPPFDFRVDGVTSISADLHKYGYTAKGASTVTYRTRELRKHQFYVYTDWPGGIYGSPSMTGARGGAPIAAAWAVLKLLGVEGYLGLTRDVLEATERIVETIAKTDELNLMGRPVMSLIGFDSDKVDVYAVGEKMAERGWHLDRLQNPKGLHLTVSPIHKQVLEPFLSDLTDVTKAVSKSGQAASGEAAMYGMLASLPDRGQVKDFVLNFLDGLY